MKIMNRRNSWPDIQYNQHINDILPTVPPPLLAPMHETSTDSRWQIEFGFEETKVPAFGSDLPVFIAGESKMRERVAKQNEEQSRRKHKQEERE